MRGITIIVATILSTVFHFFILTLLDTIPLISQEIPPQPNLYMVDLMPLPAERPTPQKQEEATVQRTVEAKKEEVKKEAVQKEEVKREEFNFGKFSARMRSGDLILLGPSSYTTDKITLSSIFFNNPNEGGYVRLYLIICARVV